MLKEIKTDHFSDFSGILNYKLFGKFPLQDFLKIPDMGLTDASLIWQINAPFYYLVIMPIYLFTKVNAIAEFQDNN